MIDIKIHIIPKWQIKGYPNYVFTPNKKLYNLKTSREIIMKVKGGYTKGYNIKGKFKSLKTIKPLIRYYKEIESLPF